MLHAPSDPSGSPGGVSDLRNGPCSVLHASSAGENAPYAFRYIDAGFYGFDAGTVDGDGNTSESASGFCGKYQDLFRRGVNDSSEGGTLWRDIGYS